MGFAIPNYDGVAYPAMARIFSSDFAIMEASNEDHYCLSGGSVVASATTGKLKVNTGIDFNGNWEIIYSATDNIDCCTNADSTYPLWALLEMDSSGAPHLNVGTAAASPIPPTPTAGRVVHAAIYIPAGATAIDTVLTSPNGKAKIIDKRCIKTTPPRLLGTSSAFLTAVTNPVSLTSIVTTGLITIPANSLSNFEVIDVQGSFLYKNTQNNSTLRLVVVLGANNQMDVTFASLASDTNNRYVVFQCAIDIRTTIFTTVMQRATVSTASASTPATVTANWVGSTSASHVQDNDQAVDVKVQIGTPSSTATCTLQELHIIKYPA